MMHRIILSISLCCYTLFSFGQDPHYSQYFASPQVINPANAGFLPGKYRAAILYRDQWRTAIERAYQSRSAHFDLKLNSPFDLLNRDKLGIGLSLSNERVGVINLNNNTLGLGLAYHKFLSKKGNQYLRAGFQMSFNQRNLNYENLNFSSEFNGIDAYDQDNLEDLQANIFAFTNFNLGISYTADFNGGFGIIIGGAMHNVFEPEVSFYQDDPNRDISSVAYRRYSVHSSINIPVNDYIDIIPRALYTVQGPYSRLNVGTNIRIRISDYGDYALQLGAWMRMAGAAESLQMNSLVGLVGIELKGFNLGVSYDAYLGQTIGSDLGRKAIELSFSYIGLYEDEFVFCPSF